MSLRKSILIKSRIAFIIIACFAAAVIVQAVKLAVIDREEYQEAGKKFSFKTVEVKAVRGNILSVDGRLLATSLPKYDIRFDTRAPGITDELFKSNIDSLALLCANTFTDRSYKFWLNYLTKAREKHDRYVLIKRNVSYEIAKAMNSWPIFREGRYKGGLIKEEFNVREMPFGRMARRTIGFTTRDGNSVGLELAYDSILRGKSGKRLEQRISTKVWRPIEDTEFDMEDGLDLVTSIDINIQDVAESALKSAMERYNAQSGCAILMEVSTGAVRAIANFSRLDDGRFFENMNIGIGVASDPGSTFKLASALALLEEGAIKNLDDSVDINYGKMEFYDRTLKDAHISDERYTTFRHVIEASSNVGVAGLVNNTFKANPQKYIDYLSKLNLDRPLGIEIKEEGNIKIKKPEDKDWHGTTLPWTSIGYETRITALQTLAMYNAVANGGKLVRPYFVSEIRNKNKTVWKHQPEIINEKICSDRTLGMLQELLVGVVEHGTARNLKNLDYKVAGKTGTAQIFKGTKFDKNSHKASFVGYFPADNPQYSCIVVINAPQGGAYYGNIVAGPVFREISDKVYATLLDIHPEIPSKENIELPFAKNGPREEIKTVLNKFEVSSHTVEGDIANEWVHATRQEKYVRLTPIDIKENKMPNVKGMGARDAIYLLESMGLNVITQGYGWVKYQSVEPNTDISNGGRVFIELKP